MEGGQTSTNTAPSGNSSDFVRPRFWTFPFLSYDFNWSLYFLMMMIMIYILPY